MKVQILRRRARWFWAGTLVALACAPFTSLLAGGTAHADGSFDATASAYGFDFVFSNAVIPAGISPEGAGPVAQSELTSLPSGTSFASFPYPGDVVAGVPGLAGGIVTGLPTIPPYPAIVSSGLGQGARSQNLPGIAMSADTEAGQARAHAVFGTDAQGASADSNVVNDPNAGVSATATALDNALGFGSLGTIGSVLTTVTATQAPDGTVSTKSHLELTGIRFPTLDLTIPKTSPAPAPIPGVPIPVIPIPFGGTELKDPELGFVDGAFTVQLPLLGNQSFQIPGDAVLAAFKAIGVDVTYTAPIVKATSIVGATLTFHTTLPQPPAAVTKLPELGNVGPTPVDVVFGRASASIDASSGGGGLTVVPGPSGTTGGSVPSTTGTGSTTGSNVAPPGATAASGALGSGGAVVAATGGLPGAATTAGSVPAPVTAGPAATGQPQVALARELARRPPLNWGIYLVLVAAAVIGTFSTQTLRLLGVRHR